MLIINLVLATEVIKIDSKNLLLGIDIGTSSIKFSIVDRELKEYYYHAVKYKYITLNEDWTEIDPVTWSDIIFTEFSKIFKLPLSKRIMGICPTAQMHTIVFLDNKYTPVRNAIMWNDRRTKNIISNLKKDLVQNLGISYNANIISTGSPLSSIMWLKENEPENFRRIKKVCMCKDYINLFLTGKIATDYCDASTSGLMDLEKGSWSRKICSYFGIDIGILPNIQDSTAKVGILKDSICQSLSIKKAIPIFTGTGDNAATLLATKYCEKAKLVLSLGTSGVVLSENNQLSLTGQNILFKYSNKKCILSQTSLSTGGKSFDWWVNDVLNASDYSEEQRFTKEKIANNKVLFLPYLSGEKYLYKNPDISGVFYNLNINNDRFDLNLAVLEGVTFALKSLYLNSNSSKQKLNSLILLGGGSKSDTWAKIVANIFDTTVIRFNEPIEAVTGALIIGLLGLNEKITIHNKIEKKVKAEQKLVKHYQEKYKYFCVVSDKINELSAVVKKKFTDSNSRI